MSVEARKYRARAKRDKNAILTLKINSLSADPLKKSMAGKKYNSLKSIAWLVATLTDIRYLMRPPYKNDLKL